MNIYDKISQRRRYIFNTISIMQSPASVQFLMLYMKLVRIIQLCSIVSVQMVDSFFFFLILQVINMKDENEGEFQECLNDFAFAVWSLLATVSASSSRGWHTITAIKFLTTVSISVHHIVCS